MRSPLPHLSVLDPPTNHIVPRNSDEPQDVIMLNPAPCFFPASFSRSCVEGPILLLIETSRHDYYPHSHAIFVENTPYC